MIDVRRISIGNKVYLLSVECYEFPYIYATSFHGLYFLRGVSHCLGVNCKDHVSSVAGRLFGCCVVAPLT